MRLFQPGGELRVALAEMGEIAREVRRAPPQGIPVADDIVFPRALAFLLEAEIRVGMEPAAADQPPRLRREFRIAAEESEFVDPLVGERFNEEGAVTGAERAEGDPLPLGGEPQELFQLGPVSARLPCPLSGARLVRGASGGEAQRLLKQRPLCRSAAPAGRRKCGPK